MSDYGALHSTQGAVQGTDQEQPFNTYYGAPLQTAVSNGTIPVSALNTMVQRVLTVMFQYGLFTHPRTGSPGATVTTPAHQSLAAQVAEAGTTLLKNDSGTLPLPTLSASVAVIGPAASVSPTYAGGGSAYVIPSLDGHPAGRHQAAIPTPASTYTQGLPADTSLAAIPASSLSPAYPSGGTAFGGSYSGTLTAPAAGTYVLGITNPCGCYTSTYLTRGRQAGDRRPEHAAGAHLLGGGSADRGHAFSLSISGASLAAAVGDAGRPGAGLRRGGRRGEGGVHRGRGRLRRHRVRGHGPARPVATVCPGRADLRCRRGQPAHRRRHRRGRACRDAVAAPRSRRWWTPGTRGRPAARHWPACCSGRPIPAATYR